MDSRDLKQAWRDGNYVSTPSKPKPKIRRQTGMLVILNRACDHWGIQIYWPELRITRWGCNFTARTCFSITWKHRTEGWLSIGFALLGFGFGVLYFSKLE